MRPEVNTTAPAAILLDPDARSWFLHHPVEALRLRRGLFHDLDWLRTDPQHTREGRHTPHRVSVCRCVPNATWNREDLCRASAGSHDRRLQHHRMWADHPASKASICHTLFGRCLVRLRIKTMIKTPGCQATNEGAPLGATLVA